jgi:hypothetical protein
MILCTKKEMEEKLFDYVQTMLEIQDDEDLKIISYKSSPAGYYIDYKIWNDPNWIKKSMTLFNADILLIEFSKQK